MRLDASWSRAAFPITKPLELRDQDMQEVRWGKSRRGGPDSAVRWTNANGGDPRRPTQPAFCNGPRGEPPGVSNASVRFGTDPPNDPEPCRHIFPHRPTWPSSPVRY